MSKQVVSMSAIGARYLLGVLFLVFGLNGFLHFLPTPPPEGATAQAFLGGLAQSGYFFPFLKGTEVLAAIALLSGYFVPLALTVLAPIVLNIVLYHRLLAPGAPLDLILLALLIAAAWGYRDSFRGVVRARVPASA